MLQATKNIPRNTLTHKSSRKTRQESVVIDIGVLLGGSLQIPQFRLSE